MAGELVINKIQFGEDLTASNNFVLKQANTPNQTLVLSNGNIGTEIDRIIFGADGTIQAVAPTAGDASTKLVTSQFVRDNRIFMGTAQNASGTAVSYTGIPSWVKKITFMLSGVSTNGTAVLLIQLGTSSGYVTSGYYNVAQGFSGASVAAGNFTAGFGLEESGTATYALSGEMTFSLVTGNTWIGSGGFIRAAGIGSHSYGGISLASTFDRIRLTTANGTDAFDGGIVNIMYE